MAFAIPPPYLYFIAACEGIGVSGFRGVRGEPGDKRDHPDRLRGLPERQAGCLRERPFVSDIFDEVDEEVRREQLQKLWDRYGNLFIALAVLIVVGVAGWRGYDYWQSKQAAAAGTKFTDAALLSESGKHEEAEKAFAQVAANAPSGYKVLARVREAAEIAKRDPKAAVAAYDDIAANAATGQPFRDLAALRAAMLVADSAPFPELSRRLEPLTGADAPFRHSARELLAFAAWKAGDMAAVKKWAQLIRDDPETPASLRERVEVLQALTTESGKG